MIPFNLALKTNQTFIFIYLDACQLNKKNNAISMLLYYLLPLSVTQK